MEVISRMTGTYMHLRKVPHMTIAVHHGRETALIGSDRWKMNTTCVANVAALFRFFMAYTRGTQAFIHGLEARVPHHSAQAAQLGSSLATLRDMHARRARCGEATHPNNAATAWTGYTCIHPWFYATQVLQQQAVLQLGLQVKTN